MQKDMKSCKLTVHQQSLGTQNPPMDILSNFVRVNSSAKQHVQLKGLYPAKRISI